MKHFLLISLLILAVLAAAAGWAWSSYQGFLAAPLAIPAEGVVMSVAPGSSGRKIVDELAQRGYTRADWRWQALMRLQPRLYHVGEFRLESGMTPAQVLDHLASGRVITYRFTVVEGWSFKQLLERLALDPVLVQDLPDADSEEWSQLMTELELEHPEGWFLPETYVFTRGDSVQDILRRAHRSMQQALGEAWSARQTGLPLETPYEMLILASIIEKETALDSEREQIAGVFVRRLNKRMRLQTDPTVIYGMGENYDGDIRRSDLRTDTPYNTYTRHGLPPTPIALPGTASLMAAGAPDSGDTLYFVADGDGGHTFSVTLEEHQAAVRRYLEKTRG